MQRPSVRTSPIYFFVCSLVESLPESKQFVLGKIIVVGHM